MKTSLAISMILLSMLYFVLPLSGVNNHKSYTTTGFRHDTSILKSTPARIEKEIVGYYPNWLWYRRNHLVNPTTLDYEKYTVINYAFFTPMSDGSIVSTDAWADENLLLGPTIWWPEVVHDSTQSLPYRANLAGVKVLPSIGGWSDLTYFPAIAADPVKRQTFVQNCLSLIQTYKFNGIDLDWEYPGYAPNGGTQADAPNFTSLLQDIRTALNNLETQTGQAYLLSACFGAAQGHMQNIQWNNVVPLLDMINLMTYDFHGPWDTLSNHNTPLYSPAVGDTAMCIEAAFNLLTQTYNVPANKINLGIAFYGKAFANCTQLYGTHNGYDASTFPDDAGQPRYYDILNSLNLFTYYWDDQVKCPYLLGNTLSTFVSYDDEASIGYKARFVNNNDAQGVIIWEITGDYVETTPGSGIIAGTSLLDSLSVILSESEVSLPPDNPGLAPETTVIDFQDIYPNPFRLRANISFTVYKTTPIVISVFNIKGQCVKSLFSSIKSKGNYEITWNGTDNNGKAAPSGIYLIKLTGNRETHSRRVIRLK